MLLMPSYPRSYPRSCPQSYPQSYPHELPARSPSLSPAAAVLRQTKDYTQVSPALRLCFHTAPRMADLTL